MFKRIKKSKWTHAHISSESRLKSRAKLKSKFETKSTQNQRPVQPFTYFYIVGGLPAVLSTNISVICLRIFCFLVKLAHKSRIKIVWQMEKFLKNRFWRVWLGVVITRWIFSDLLKHTQTLATHARALLCVCECFYCSKFVISSLKQFAAGVHCPNSIGFISKQASKLQINKSALENKSITAVCSVQFEYLPKTIQLS